MKQLFNLCRLLIVLIGMENAETAILRVPATSSFNKAIVELYERIDELMMVVSK